MLYILLPDRCLIVPEISGIKSGVKVVDENLKMKTPVDEKHCSKNAEMGHKKPNE